MKLLHTADLHLGKQFNDVSLLDDQEAILQQIVEIAKNERVDGVLIAGDVYQQTAPAAEAMVLFDRFVTALKDAGIEVFAISGNHDSALRLSYFAGLLGSSGVHFTEVFDGEIQHVSLQDEYGEAIIWMLPFLRPSNVRQKLPEAKVTSYQTAIEAVLATAPIDPAKRNILMCHQFVTGAETSDSEVRMVGGLDNIDASLFDAFDYVALGHIHKPQRMSRETLRYAGSPLKYSFSEESHRKSVSIVELAAKGDISVKQVPLYPVHDVRTVEGTIEELTKAGYSEDYVWVTVHDEIVPPDAKLTLSVTYPNMLKFSVVNSKTKVDMDVLAAGRMEERSVLELFEDFYKLQNNDQAPGEPHRKVLEQVLRELEENR